MRRAYELCQRLGAGGMGEVLLARDRTVSPPRLVAIKRLHAHLAEEPERRAMFLAEARLAARIRHPNVVATLDVVDEPESPLLVMEYVDGASLSKLLETLRARREALPLAVAVAIVSDVLLGLQAAHETTDERGQSLALVHRDVSPHNVLVGRDGVSRVIDFGIARTSDRAFVTVTGQIKGKLAYMPPEQFRGQVVSARADLYATGAMLWECLTGRRFRDGNEGEIVEQILVHDVDAPSRFVPELPLALDEVVLRAVSASPEQRPASAAAMRDALCAAAVPAASTEVASFLAATLPAELAALTELTTRIAVPAPLQAPGGRRPAIALAASLVFAACCVIVALAITRETSPAPASAAVGAASSSPVPPVVASEMAEPSATAPSTLSVTPRRAPSPRRTALPTKEDCKVPFVVDEEGTRHYKRECLK